MPGPKATDAKYTVVEPAARWIGEQVASGRYNDAESYLAALVARDREDAQRLAALHAALDEGMASGVSDRSIEEIIADCKARPVRAGWAKAAARLARSGEDVDWGGEATIAIR